MDNISIEQQSNTLWQEQMNLAAVNRFDSGFWEAYHRLITQAKSNQSLSEVQAVAIAEDQTIQYLSKYGANLPTKFDYVAADTSLVFSKTLIVSLSMLVLNVLFLFLGSFGWALAGMVITILLIIIHFSFSNSTSPETLDIQLRLEPLHLEYHLYHYKTTQRVNILLPYASIGALWQHEQGVKVISQGGEDRWQDVDKKGLYEIILPQQMVGYADLCRFINEIASYNYQQKEIRIK